MNEAEAIARKRFFLLNLVRLFALAMVMAGAANLAGKLWPAYTPTLGTVLFILGAADFFLAPLLLKRLWARDSR